jgi:hypothetical protein
VAGIGATLETCNDIVVGSQKVNDLSFALIAPLQTKQYIYHNKKLMLK